MTTTQVQKPTIGRIVLYRLSEVDASLIASRRAATHHTSKAMTWNMVSPGEAYPAVVVRTFGGSAVNLRVLLDGTDEYWACSRMEGEPADGHESGPGTIPPGTWCWPPRA